MVQYKQCKNLQNGMRTAIIKKYKNFIKTLDLKLTPTYIILKKKQYRLTYIVFFKENVNFQK